MPLHFASTFLFMLQVATYLAEDPEMVVLIADNGDISHPGALYKVNIHDLAIRKLAVTNIARPVGINFDKGEGLVYFTDLNTRQIMRVGINGGAGNVVAQLNATSGPEGLTLDLNTRQVFYTDNGNNVIGRVEMDNFNHAVIVNTGLDKPRGIVSDTKNKRLYWVDRGANPKIETSGYSGGQRSTIIYTNINEPSDITLDEEAGRLYWTDLDKVESVHVDGKNRITLTRSHDLLVGISLFNGFLYYTDLNYTGLVSSTVNHQHFHFTFWRKFSVLKRPVGIHVYSPNFEVTSQCPYGKYGKDCKDCGNCLLGAPCEKTTGICLGPCQTGYRMEKCNERCRPGTYGKRCSFQCPANCKLDSVCDFVNGTCPEGCQVGWMGENCTIAKEVPQPTDGTPVEVPQPTDGTPVGLIVGLAVGASVVIIAAIVAVIFIVRRKRNQPDTMRTTMGVDNVNYFENKKSAGDPYANVY